MKLTFGQRELLFALRTYLLPTFLDYRSFTGSTGVSTVVPDRFDTQPMSLLACDYTLDLDRQILSVEWEILGYAGRDLTTCRLQGTLDESVGYGLFNQSVDVYFNDVPSKVFSYDPAKIPANPTQGPTFIQDLSSFRMEHELYLSANAVDSYEFNVLAFAIDPTTNTSVSIAQFGFPYPLDWLAVTSHGTIMKKEIAYHLSGVSTATEVKNHALTVKFKLSGSARVFNVSIFAMNWVLTIGVVYFTWEHASGRVSALAVFLHASSALVITIIRNLYVGTPPFGNSSDIVGFLPQISALSLSSVAALYNISKPYLRTGRVPGPEKA